MFTGKKTYQVNNGNKFIQEIKNNWEVKVNKSFVHKM